MQLNFVCKEEKNTVMLGEAFGTILKEGDIVAMTGDLGAGKTHFTGGIGKSLGISEYITSPTFTILNEYCGTMPLYHFDLYRIENEEELFDTGFWEYVEGSGVTVIEWPEVALSEMKKDKRKKDRIYCIDIKRRDDISPTYREITIEGNGRLDLIDYTVN